jgi:hypothetical protein
MNPVIVTKAQIEETLRILRASGERNSEGIVLWLGRRGLDGISVEKVWCPPHRAGTLFFEIPEAAMTQLFKELRGSRQMIAAQVHSHPRKAFHSKADDDLAVVRHVGALSLVVPYFARDTDVESFSEDAASFVLTTSNEWTEIIKEELRAHLRIT